MVDDFINDIIEDRLAEIANLEFKLPKLTWAQRKSDIYRKFQDFKRPFGENLPEVLKKIEEKLK